MAKKKAAKPLTVESADESTADKGAVQPDFEQAMEQLETIVNRLERGEGSLDDALNDYATAVRLMKVCREKLDHAERKIELLSGVDAEGHAITETLESENLDLDGKRESRGARRSAQPSKSGRAKSNDQELF